MAAEIKTAPARPAMDAEIKAPATAGEVCRCRGRCRPAGAVRQRLRNGISSVESTTTNAQTDNIDFSCSKRCTIHRSPPIRRFAGGRLVPAKSSCRDNAPGGRMIPA
jgi:hypothetical protein